MTRFYAPLAWLVFMAPALPAFADYISDQVDGCAAPLSPASRQAVIAACSNVIQMGELPATIESPAYVARGNAHALGADFARALTDYSAAIDSDPRNPTPLAARGLTLMKQKRFQDAWNDFDAAVKLDGKNAMGLYGRGLSAQALGQDGGADMAHAAALDSGMAQFYAENGLAP
jgi:tetratricopeptide (TPR) repeat protein